MGIPWRDPTSFSKSNAAGTAPLTAHSGRFIKGSQEWWIVGSDLFPHNPSAKASTNQRRVALYNFCLMKNGSNKAPKNKLKGPPSLLHTILPTRGQERRNKIGEDEGRCVWRSCLPRFKPTNQGNSNLRRQQDHASKCAFI
jgi:hypothetical protein